MRSYKKSILPSGVKKAAAAAEPKMTFIMKELINKFEE